MASVAQVAPVPARSLTEASNPIAAIAGLELAVDRFKLKGEQRRKIRGIDASAEKDHVVDKHGHDSWRSKIVHLIHSRRVQLVLAMLLLVDVAVVMVELFIEAEYPRCSYVVRDAVSCCAAEGAHGADEHASHIHRLLATDGSGSGSGSGDGHHALCAAAAVESTTAAGCDSHKWSGVHTAHDVLFGTSVAILGIFFVELLLLVLALGKVFFQHKLYVLDLLVVGGSLVLELTLRSSAAVAAIAEVIIFARLWRLVRIGHGLFTQGVETSEREVHELKEKLDELRKTLEAH